MSPAPQRLTVLEKIGYSGGDAAANFVFMTMVLFQTNFYTDVVAGRSLIRSAAPRNDNYTYLVTTITLPYPERVLEGV